jgi:hypothetical protein
VNCAHGPTAVDRTAWIWHVTFAAPAGRVLSVNFLSPHPPQNTNPPLPTFRHNMYIVPWLPTELSAVT